MLYQLSYTPMWWAFSRSVMKCAGGTFHSSESPTKEPTEGKADWESRTPLYDAEKLHGNSAYLKWWAFGDSNPGPTGYEPAALTN